MPTGLGHAGDVSPAEALELVSKTPGAVLVDCRTTTEWEQVGVPDLTSVGAKPVFIEWLSAPGMAPNPDFAAQLEAELTARGADKSTPLLFLCRSGARSTAAARTLTSLGYENSHNVEGGFEGSPSQNLPGWRQSGLPWSID